MIHKQKLTKSLGDPNEKAVFHGSSSDAIKKIYEFGFNRSYCGKNGTIFLK